MKAVAITAVLGLDQAARSGWGIALVGQSTHLLAHGVATTHAERKAVAELAVRHAGVAAQLLVMREDHAGMPLSRLTRDDRDTRRSGRLGRPERSTASILGQGAAWGRWEAVLDELGHPERLRLSVEPRTWRARVLGTARGDTEACKKLAVRWASAQLGKPIEDADEAEGIALTVFAAVDGVALLEQRRLKQRLYARGKREERRQLELGGVREVAR